MTREERDKNVRRNQLIIGVLLIGLMLFSTIGYALGRGDDSLDNIEYNGVEFVMGGSGYWEFNVDGFEFFTKYNPSELEDISFLNFKSLNDYSGNTLYFVGDEPEPIIEMKRNLNYFVRRINDACLDENCVGDLPVKNCSEDNVIVVEESDVESFEEREKCVIISASLGNQTRYADAFLFELLGIR